MMCLSFGNVVSNFGFRFAGVYELCYVTREFSRTPLQINRLPPQSLTDSGHFLINLDYPETGLFKIAITAINYRYKTYICYL